MVVSSSFKGRGGGTPLRYANDRQKSEREISGAFGGHSAGYCSPYLGGIAPLIWGYCYPYSGGFGGYCSPYSAPLIWGYCSPYLGVLLPLFGKYCSPYSGVLLPLFEGIAPLIWWYCSPYLVVFFGVLLLSFEVFFPPILALLGVFWG